MLSSTSRTRAFGFRLGSALRYFPWICRVGRYSRTHLFQNRSARNWTCFHFLLYWSAFSKTPEGRQMDFVCMRKCARVSGCRSLGSCELALRALPFSTLSIPVRRVFRTGSVTTCVPRIAFKTVLALRTRHSQTHDILEAVGGWKIHLHQR